MNVIHVPAALWDSGELLIVDEWVHAAEGGPILFDVDADRADEVFLRYQRLFPTRNEGSATRAFARVLAEHRDRHDLSKPLVRVDLDHAHDVWQWVLRLEPRASVEVQLAGLFHDIERLESESTVRIERSAPDYQAFKDAHARRGAEIVGQAIAGGPWDVGRVQWLVAHHERRDIDPERALLADADGLSFFALNSPGYLQYFGEEATGDKVRYTWARLTERARGWLRRVRLPPRVRAMVDDLRAQPFLAPPVRRGSLASMER